MCTAPGLSRRHRWRDTVSATSHRLAVGVDPSRVEYLKRFGRKISTSVYSPPSRRGRVRARNKCNATLDSAQPGRSEHRCYRGLTSPAAPKLKVALHSLTARPHPLEGGEKIQHVPHLVDLLSSRVDCMRCVRLITYILVLGGILAPSSLAHHSISAKFDESKPVTLDGTVSLVDWKNPHVHLFMDVRASNGIDRWVIELESRVDLGRSGWRRESVRPGDAITVQGIAARDGSRQAWAKAIVLTSTGKRVLDAAPFVPPPVKAGRPAPRWPSGQPRL